MPWIKCAEFSRQLKNCEDKEESEATKIQRDTRCQVEFWVVFVEILTQPTAYPLLLCLLGTTTLGCFATPVAYCEHVPRREVSHYHV